MRAITVNLVDSDNATIHDAFARGAVPVIETDHNRVHAGQAYAASGKATGINVGVSFDILLKNPAGNFPHLRIFEFDSDKAPADIYLYEAPTTTANGTAVTMRNMSRNSSNTMDLLVYTGPTVTGVGTQLEYHQITGGKTTGGSASEVSNEWVLKPSTDYLLRFTAGANSTTVGWYLFAYES